MVEPIDKPTFDPKNGVKITWDQHGNAFAHMPVNGIPKFQFDEWVAECRFKYSGKRWDMIMAEHLKARAYDALLMTIPEEDDSLPEKDHNPEGLLNGGKD